MKRTTAHRLGIGGILLFLGLSATSIILIYHVFPYSPIRPGRVSGLVRAQYDSAAARSWPGFRTISPFDVSVEDSITLKALFIRAEGSRPRGTVLVLHGIGSCKESYLGFAQTLSQAGFNCVLLDLRAHGESGGVNCTFGYYEKHDVSVCIDTVQKKFSDAGPIAIYGHSLGAAVAVQTMAIDPRIKCGVVGSTFATLRETIYDYWLQMGGIPIHFVPNEALTESEKIARFSVDSVSPEESAARIACPVLVVHGTKDKKISISYGERVFKRLHNPQSRWYPIEGAGHDDLLEVGGSAYLRTIIDFLLMNER